MPTQTADDAPRPPRLQILPGVLRRSVARWGFLRGESSCAADKRQLIDDIQAINTSASTRFLIRFDVSALREYHAHLVAARSRHLPKQGRRRRAVDHRVVA